ncbi:MAG: hypothetical protein MUQ99_09380, partial [Pseudomonadales bacterium]|nr:hypothetical protein [Pseudomonadales bacterium]
MKTKDNSQAIATLRLKHICRRFNRHDQIAMVHKMAMPLGNFESGFAEVCPIGNRDMHHVYAAITG